MIFTTTSTIEGREVEQYLGILFGDTVLGMNIFRDLLGGLRDIVGGRSGSWEREVAGARDAALSELLERAKATGADAVLGINIDYEVVGANGSMMMVTASGTAVKLKPAPGGAGPWTRPSG